MSLLYISENKYTCDFCKGEKQVASLNNKIVVCKECLQGFINEFNKELDGEEKEHTA